MTDRVISTLVGMENRFQAHGHDVAISHLHDGLVGESTLTCKECRQDAVVAFTNEYGAWWLPETPLDLKCPGGAS